MEEVFGQMECSQTCRSLTNHWDKWINSPMGESRGQVHTSARF